MKIKSIYIHSFGKLQDFSLTFDDGLNKILKDNGFGKTTIAVFIKCMFYGIKGGNKGGLSDDNERLKYYTWESSQLIGGTLDFELNNVTYRIERYFGQRPIQDTFKITNLKTNKPANFNENVGEEIFKIDENSFVRSIYLPQKVLDFNKEAGSISQKLNDLTYEDDSNISIDQAITQLETLTKNYYKSSGKAGLIHDSQNSISNLQVKINECDLYYKNVYDIEEEINNVDAKINEITLQLNKLKPSIEHEIRNQAIVLEQQKLKENFEQSNLRYLELKDAFENLDINIETLDQYIALSQELVKIESKISAIEDSFKDIDIKTLSDKFKNCTYSTIDIDNMLSNVTKNNQKSIPPYLNLFYILLTIGIVISSIGIASFILNVILGVVLLCIGTFAIVISIIFKKKSSSTFANITSKANQEIENILKKYGYDIDKIEESLIAFKRDLMLYNNLINNSPSVALKSELEERKLKVVDTLNLFLSNFYDQINDTYTNLLIDIKNDFVEYLNLKDMLSNIDHNFKLKESDFDSHNLNNLKQNEEKLSTELSDLIKEKEKLNNLKLNNLERASVKSDLVQELDHEKQLFEKYFNEYKIASSTINFLKQAKDNISNRYLAPLTELFVKNLNHLTRQNFSIIMDNELNINLVLNNKSKNVAYYSSGYKDIINISLRLALIEYLFKDEKPFIILDDPFVNLDNKTFDLVKNAIEEIANTYQIIYLTCNTSRT